MLETPRLRLVPWHHEDWHELRPIARDPEVMRYISEGQPLPDEQVQEFVSRQVRHFAERNFCMWKLLAKPAWEFIGFCGLQPLDGTPEIEIGWWLARAWWGKGLATEAAREALRDGFERAGLARIVAVARAENRASIRIMEKLGMSFERTTHHRGVPVKLYAIARPTAEGALPHHA